MSSIPEWATKLDRRLARLEGKMEMLISEVDDLKRKVNGAVRNSAQNKGTLAAWTAVVAAIVSGGIALVVRVLAAAT